MDLPEFTPDLAHLLLQGVYRDLLHHNDRSHLYGGVLDKAVWQRCWRRLAVYLASWYATPSGAVGCWLMAILAAEWRGVLRRTWYSKIPLVFSHVVLMKMLGVCRARDIWDRITRKMDLWERGIHMGLVKGIEVEGAVREGRYASGG